MRFWWWLVAFVFAWMFSFLAINTAKMCVRDVTVYAEPYNGWIVKGSSVPWRDKCWVP